MEGVSICRRRQFINYDFSPTGRFANPTLRQLRQFVNHELLLLTKEHTGTYYEFCQILIWFILSINFIMKGEFGITFKY